MFPSCGTGPWEGAFNQQGKWTNYWWWFQNKQFIEGSKVINTLSSVTGLPGPVTTITSIISLSPVWVLAQCCLLTLAFSLRVTVPTSILSWLSVPWHWPTKIYICPSLSLMLPFNIGLPKTPPGLVLDRCHEPCPSVIPNTDQPRPNTDLWVWPSVTPTLVQSRLSKPGPSVTPMLVNPDYCFLEPVMRVKPRQLHQMAVSTNPSLGGCVIQLVLPLSDMENYWEFQGYTPFTPPFLKYNCQYSYQDNWTRIFSKF